MNLLVSECEQRGRTIQLHTIISTRPTADGRWRAMSVAKSTFQPQTCSSLFPHKSVDSWNMSLVTRVGRMPQVEFNSATNIVDGSCLSPSAVE
ncbi:hypothetical protein Mapa_010662 [Marchantia paleacea]|nr:hypothetical protein Mapa_010662 [Marchantia paleacea]